MLLAVTTLVFAETPCTAAESVDAISLVDGKVYHSELTRKDFLGQGKWNPSTENLAKAVSGIDTTARDLIKTVASNPKQWRLTSIGLHMYEPDLWYWSVRFCRQAADKDATKHEYAEFYLKPDGTPGTVTPDDSPVLLNAAQALMLSRSDYDCDFSEGIELQKTLGGKESARTLKIPQVVGAGRVDPSTMREVDVVMTVLTAASKKLPTAEVGASQWIAVDIELVRVGMDSGFWSVRYWPKESKTEDTVEVIVLLDGTALSAE